MGSVGRQADRNFNPVRVVNDLGRKIDKRLNPIWDMKRDARTEADKARDELNKNQAEEQKRVEQEKQQADEDRRRVEDEQRQVGPSPTIVDPNMGERDSILRRRRLAAMRRGILSTIGTSSRGLSAPAATLAPAPFALGMKARLGQ